MEVIDFIFMTDIKKTNYQNIDIVAGDLTFHLVADPKGNVKKEDIAGVSRREYDENGSGFKDVYLDKKDLSKLGINLNGFNGKSVDQLSKEIPKVYAQNLAEKGEVRLVNGVINYSKVEEFDYSPRVPTSHRISFLGPADGWTDEVTLKVYKKASEKFETLIKNIGETPPKVSGEPEANSGFKLIQRDYEARLNLYQNFVAQLVFKNPERTSEIKKAAEGVGIRFEDIERRVENLRNPPAPGPNTLG